MNEQGIDVIHKSYSRHQIAQKAPHWRRSLDLTMAGRLITINLCDRRKWNARNWLILGIPGI